MNPEQMERYLKSIGDKSGLQLLKGVRFSWRYYFKAGGVLTVPTLLITLTGLWRWLTVS